MKIWWQQLNIREQKLITILAAILSIFILYSALWQPLNDNLLKANNKLVRQQALLTWVTDKTKDYQQAKGTVNLSRPGDSLSGIVNESAKSFQLTITRMQPQGDDLQVWIDSISFTKLLFWLEHLANNKNLQIQGIDLTSAELKGEVQVRRLQLAKQ